MLSKKGTASWTYVFRQKAEFEAERITSTVTHTHKLFAWLQLREEPADHEGLEDMMSMILQIQALFAEFSVVFLVTAIFLYFRF